MEGPRREEPSLTCPNIIGLVRIQILGYIHFIADCICAAAVAVATAAAAAAANASGKDLGRSLGWENPLRKVVPGGEFLV